MCFDPPLEPKYSRLQTLAFFFLPENDLEAFFQLDFLNQKLSGYFHFFHVLLQSFHLLDNFNFLSRRLLEVLCDPLLERILEHFELLLPKEGWRAEDETLPSITNDVLNSF